MIQRLLKSGLVTACALTGVLGAAGVAQAFDVYGLIAQKWVHLGGATGKLGPATSSEMSDGKGGRINLFQGGFIDWIPGNAEAYATYGNIGHAWWTRYGGVGGFGRPLTDELDGPSGGKFNRFEGGKSLYFTPPHVCMNADQVCEVYGAINAAYNDIGGASSVIGYPVGEEYDCIFGQTRLQAFENGIITWDKNGPTCVYQGHTVIYSVNGRCSDELVCQIQQP
jgi:uncharacterized protein with LGFP repeats